LKFSCNCVASDLSERVMVSGQDHALFSGRIVRVRVRVSFRTEIALVS